MNYLIYFDESNKIDQFNDKFSYYGAYGGADTSLAIIVKKVREIFKNTHSNSELHFAEYTKDRHIKKYFQTLDTVINEDIRMNILIVNNEDALNSAANIGLTAQELRSLFYIKIPERLFYGLTRDLSHLDYGNQLVNVKIKIDQNDEYEKLRLNEKLIEQMNAHSAYRNKNYRVNKVISQDSRKSIPLQIIDAFMGIVVFLLEKNYLEDTDVSKIKSDLIYRFLIEKNNLERFQQQIRLFQWTGHEELTQINIAEHLSPFMVSKTAFDIDEIVKIQKVLLRHPECSTKELREALGYPNTMLRLLLGYKDQLSGFGRNTYIRS
ncbi:hypothetical protein EU245_13565 [Lentibacillus lipolyticus]|nr:hypothetical protein EU245_13565 [Lentibacillus lipolyticus]